MGDTTDQDVRDAFAHPEARAKTTASGPPLDRISLRDHIVEVEIGAFQVERGITQRLSFNIVVEVRHITDNLDDDVDLILSYDRVTEAIDIELAAERLNLLETLAERIADRILVEPQAERVFVRIEKLDRGAGALGVEIVRSVQDARTTAHSVGPKPRVLVLGLQAIASPFMSGWIAQLRAVDAPLVICVPPLAEMQQASAARTRMILLSMEQQAWALAAQFDSCEVVATRTELDWAIRNGQVSVWAPSKFVMDAVPSPLDLIDDTTELAAWFAGQLGACELVCIGGDLPKAGVISTRFVSIDQEHILKP